jgi:hypothetical protein
MDLRHSLIPEELVEEMVQTMPIHKGDGKQEDADLPKFDYEHFMQRFMGPSPGSMVSGSAATAAANGRSR